MQLSAYEVEREEQITQNKRKLQELGLLDIKPPTKAPVPRPKLKKHKAPAADQLESSWSLRQRKVVCYKEVPIKLPSERRAPIVRSPADVDQLRTTFGNENTSKSALRKPVDSGKGVRVQGGRVYDSTYGITCHWCRQKTLEEHVTCTSEACGKGRKMPTSFCKMCLQNRHGEDATAANASGKWVCPCCRDSCGAGCSLCCNCGPCRKKAGLLPTQQMVRLAKEAGYGNVHDYLVFQATGETAEKVQARKLRFAWGKWLSADAGSPAAAPKPRQKAAKASKANPEPAPQARAAVPAATAVEAASTSQAASSTPTAVAPLSRRQRAMQKIGLSPMAM